MTRRVPVASGFTLVELLATIAIIGLLIALLLPAVQSARESARRVTCSNNLKQMGLATQSFLSATGRFPTGGWGCGWVGDPDYGDDWKQPGGWHFVILPYMDMVSVYQLQSGLTGTAKSDAMRTMIQTVAAWTSCPSRRPAQATTKGNGATPYLLTAATMPTVVARSDYAANRGNMCVGGPYWAPDALNTGWGPTPYSEGIKNDPSTPQYGQPGFTALAKKAYGIVFSASMVRPAQVFDGLSNTYLYGEKYLCPDKYSTGNDQGDNESLYIGDNADVGRCATSGNPPFQDTAGVCSGAPFGSAHRGSFQMVFCDGAVKSIAYEITPTVHQYLGDRRDRQIIDGAQMP